MRHVDVARPHGRGEAVFHVVGDLDRFLDVLEREGGQHRPEDFLARDAHGRQHAVEHRGFHEVTAAVFAHAFSAQCHFGAVRLAGFDVRQHALHLCFIHDGAELGRRIERVARHHGAAHDGNFLQHRVLDGVLHQQA
jgi:hypothetical protein